MPTSSLAEICTRVARTMRCLLIVLRTPSRNSPSAGIGASAQAHRVLHRHRRALRHVLQHEVRGVAEQRDASLDPVVHRLAVEQHPAPVLLRRAHQLGRLLAVVREQRQHLVGHRELVVPAAGVLADHRGHQVEELPAAQRVMHDVRVVPGPERRRRQAQLLRHFVDLQHRAVAHVPGGGRQRVADDLLADHRAAAVGGDQRRAVDRRRFPSVPEPKSRPARIPVTRVLLRSSISSGSALQPSSSEPWMSARCVTA